MKKGILIGTIVIFAILGLLLFLNQPSSTNGKGENDLTPKQLTEQIEKEPTYVYYYQPECSYCNLIEPSILKSAEEAGINLYFVDLYTHRALWDTYKIDYTPTIVYYADGVETSRFDTIEEIFYKESDGTLQIHTDIAEEELSSFFKKNS